MRTFTRFSLTVAAAAAGLAGLGALPSTATAAGSQPGFQFDWDLPPENPGVIEIDPCLLGLVDCEEPEPDTPKIPWDKLCKILKTCDDDVDTDEGDPGDDDPGEGEPGDDDPGEGEPGDDDPGEDDPGEDDPGEGDPNGDPEPCELDEVCTRTPTFTG